MSRLLHIQRNFDRIRVESRGFVGSICENEEKKLHVHWLSE